MESVIVQQRFGATTARSPTLASERVRVTDRIAMLDALRFIAAIAIVWQHTPESSQLNPFSRLSVFAVPFFVMAGVFFVFAGVRRNPQRPTSEYLLGRFRRIYVPFLVWSVIYLAIRDLKHALLSHQSSVEFSPGILIGGSAHHLWFLPYMFVISVVAFALAKLVVGRPTTERVMAVALCIVGIAAGFGSPTFFAKLIDGAKAADQETLASIWYVCDRGWNMVPAVLWGAALGAIFPIIPARIWSNRAIGIIGLGVSMVCIAIALTPYRTILSDNVAAVGLVALALSRWTTATVNQLAKLGGLAYGIYLCHVMFIEGMQAVAARAGYTGRWWLDAIVFPAAAIAAIVLTWVLSRWSWGRWLMATQ
jgi:peptidoglycan/LPS O-acetylase OafA/YrhL